MGVILLVFAGIVALIVVTVHSFAELGVAPFSQAWRAWYKQQKRVNKRIAELIGEGFSINAARVKAHDELMKSHYRY